MKRVALFLAVMAFAAIAVQGSATTCPTGAYSLYLVPNFTCASGLLIFSNFGYSATANPSGIAIPAANITVTPDTTTFNEGFQFAGGWNVGTQPGPTSNFQDSLLTFDVTGSITDMHLFFNGSFTGTGLTGVAEAFCLNHALAGCPGGSGGQINVTNPPPVFNSAAFFGAASQASVSKAINLTCGGNGTASSS